ncbi:methyltransferase [Halobacillus andaensis]|uniref:Methyltransferase n=1 Tax=Halobacillus andaensis TaxID=1176239 RepID=A0A917EVH8_HALAA|nr:methylated-DNA--[protein]-cysteine S-methyltransferase [Halobacillus andaensis]MBP2004578.1 methylated-DNA-protein-cysteine methyltransferase-like protein [Halobacillus andaensis]GGF20578.1 methyltransferase [Halobacillus andaensis]
MNPFTERVLKTIRSIPPGGVMTYGQVAREAGNPRAARQVARILHSMSQKHHLPWHRVINAKGEIAIKDDETALEQQLELEDEGVVVINKKVNLQDFQWRI